MSSSQQVTIDQVARRARVSRMTVSRVISNASQVRPQTRARILRAISQLGYVPSPYARAMRSGSKLCRTQASCFALIFGVDTQTADEFFCEVARGVEIQAMQSQLSALQVHWLADLESSWFRMQRILAIEGLCGAILVGQFDAKDIQALQRVTPNVVLVDCPVPEGVSCAGVEADNLGGCLIALNRLHDQGARRVVVLGGPPDHYFTKAMESAAGSVRGRFDAVSLHHTDYSPRMGQEVISALIAGGERFDGVFGNDTLCLGAMRALGDAGARIPEQVRVIGFDDIPVSGYLRPSLTSVNVDKKRLGIQSVTSLLEMVKGNPAACGMRVVVNARLVVRESA